MNNLMTIDEFRAEVVYLPGERPAMLAQTLAKVYGVTVGHLHEKVKRNIDRFPQPKFIKWATKEQMEILRSQNAISKETNYLPILFYKEALFQLPGVLRCPMATDQSIWMSHVLTEASEGRYNQQHQSSASLFDALRMVADKLEEHDKAIKALQADAAKRPKVEAQQPRKITVTIDQQQFALELQPSETIDGFTKVEHNRRAHTRRLQDGRKVKVRAAVCCQRQ